MIDFYILLFTGIMSAFAYLIGRIQGFKKGFEFCMYAVTLETPSLMKAISEARVELHKRAT